jgi:hypothetical protein
VATTQAAPAAGTASTAAAGVTAPPPAPPPGSTTCTDPPPECPEGMSPQFTDHWECTKCDLVVTYGGTFGNERYCVEYPEIECPPDQVPTWVYEDQKWECRNTCNNGTYDQHTISQPQPGGGTAQQMVCVPC